MLVNSLYIAAAFLLVLLNGFFVAAEFALVKLRYTQAVGRPRAAAGVPSSSACTATDAYLSACQLGITLSSLGLRLIGEPAFARLLEPVFARIGGIDPETAHIICS